MGLHGFGHEFREGKRRPELGEYILLPDPSDL